MKRNKMKIVLYDEIPCGIDKGRFSAFLKALFKEKLVKKYLYPLEWTSGSSTIVRPITICKNTIILQWGSDKNIFEKFINRIVRKNSDILQAGDFWKSDGSCPSTITFYLKEVDKDDD